MKIPSALVCPNHQTPLHFSAEKTGEGMALLCQGNCRFPIRGGFPWFAEPDAFASAFGRHWQRFRSIRYDSTTGTGFALAKLERILGAPIETLKNRTILEAGCMTGRYTEILLDSGAQVHAFDLSEAVNANYANHAHNRRFFGFQADLTSLPFKPENFDAVVSLGVVHHTKNPEKTLAALVRNLKPDGLLLFDHYGPDYHVPVARDLLRRFLRLLPVHAGSWLGLMIIRILSLLHMPFWHNGWGATRLRHALGHISPVIDLYETHGSVGKKLLRRWCILETHDCITDIYKQTRTPEQLRRALETFGLVVEHMNKVGYLIEVRAVKSSPALD